MGQLTCLYNARVYTMDAGRPTVSALALRDGRVVAAGSDAEVKNACGGGADVQDMGGAVILPGLTDAHIHLEQYALGLQKVDCETQTKAKCLERVAARARTTPPGGWVLGHGWNQNSWPEGFGTAQELDAAAPDHPVYLTAKSLHAAWANTAALRLAGLDDGTPDPPDGRLGRDQNGQLNGILFESAMELVDAVTPEPTPAQTAEALRSAQPALWAMGLTGAHDFDRRRCFEALQMLRLSGELRLRVLKSLPLEALPHAAELGLSGGFGDDWIRIGGVKVFMDGALGPQTAAMLQPFEGSGGERGLLFMDGEELFEHGRTAAEHGLPLAVHAIGDRANHEALRAVAQLREFEATLPSTLGGGRRLRHRIEHVQLLHPDDARRLAELGVIASMQPIHATSDMEMADRYWGGRARYAYASKLQLDHGVVLAFGSDAPVESPNPFWGIHAAVTRQRPDGSPGPQGWMPEQRLSLGQALAAYTLGPAYAAGWEDRLGRLAPGFLADLIALEHDPFELPPDELHLIKPLATMVGGEWVFRR
ncbi:MAG: amidohydrolase [Anaerolineales bacterium]|nr:amidohydrolase [Anaerolineales bacterium]